MRMIIILITTHVHLNCKGAFELRYDNKHF